MLQIYSRFNSALTYFKFVWLWFQYLPSPHNRMKLFMENSDSARLRDILRVERSIYPLDKLNHSWNDYGAHHGPKSFVTHAHIKTHWHSHFSSISVNTCLVFLVRVLWIHQFLWDALFWNASSDLGAYLSPCPGHCHPLMRRLSQKQPGWWQRLSSLFLPLKKF